MIAIFLGKIGGIKLGFRFKRILSAILASMLGVVTSISGLCLSSDFSHIFTYKENNGNNILMGLVDNYQDLLGGITEITLPETYDGKVCKLNMSTFQKNTYFTKIVVPKTYVDITGFAKCSSVKEIVLLNDNEIAFKALCLNGCTSLEKLEIYAAKISETPVASTFKDVPTTAVAYVKNEAVKESLVNFPGNIIINPNMEYGQGNDSEVNKTALESKIQEAETYLTEIDKSQYNNIEALETELEKAKTVYNNGSATQDDINNALLDLSTALTNVVKKTDKTALAAKITEIESFLSGIDKTKYVNISLLEKELENAKTLYKNDKATQKEIDSEVEALITARNDVKEIPQTLKGNLLKAVTNYESWYAELSADDYTASSLSSANALYTRANNMLQGKGNTIFATQEEIDQMTKEMNDFRNLLVKNDASEQKAALESLIASAEKIENSNYSSASWEALQTAILSAKETASADKLRSEYNAESEALQKAIDGLTVKTDTKEEAGEPFAKIYTGGKEVTAADFNADENTAGATKIRITFNCAEDVSFNPYCTIEINAAVSGAENYMKFTGTDSSFTTGAKGCIVDLPLTSAIKFGDNIKIFASTYSWETAADYVFAVTKIELIDDIGTVLKTVTDRTIAYDELKTAIAEAEKIESANYTEESFAALTAALTAAKELPEDSAKADIEASKTALETAVAGLVEKTDDSSSEPTPDSESEPDSKQDSESSSDTDADSSSKTDSKTDNSSSKTDDSNSSTTKTDSASSNSNANTTSNANSGANGSSNPNTGAASATAAGIILLSAIGVIFSKRK